MLSLKTYPHRETHALSVGLMIHLFALAHAIVAMAGRSLHYYDDVPLTILTLAMVVIISIRMRLQVELTAIIALVAGFVGFLMGVYGALSIRILVRSDLLAPAISTFLVTELIGWGTWFVGHSRGNRASRQATEDKTQTSNRKGTFTSIFLIAGTILLLRLGYMLILRHYYAEQESIYTELARIFSNTFALLLLICGNLISVQLYTGNRHRFRRRGVHALWITCSMLIVSSLTTLCVLLGPWLQHTPPITWHQFLRLEVVSLLLCIAAYALLYLAHYVVASQRELHLERRQRHFAQYQYNRFKEQINPHFLFNSLNILDSLVQEGERERAGTFIRKLAGIYRYMLRNEEEPLVTLREEIAFADMYIDLIKERFTNGLEISRDISPEYLSHLVVPCSVQQLIENATKHNIVSPEQPLHISLRADNGRVSVENNRQPRISRRNESTRLGLKTISQQYLDVSGREIVVAANEELFRVDLPLLKPTKQ